jgi:hypothetical protein
VLPFVLLPLAVLAAVATGGSHEWSLVGLAAMAQAGMAIASRTLTRRYVEGSIWETFLHPVGAALGVLALAGAASGRYQR